MGLQVLVELGELWVLPLASGCNGAGYKIGELLVYIM